MPGAQPICRLITTILDPAAAPAEELAALYPERWEIETSLDELKTHLRGARIVLRSKTPELVEQEFCGWLMAHFAIRPLMHEAALRADEDPDQLSFLRAVRVLGAGWPDPWLFPPRQKKIFHAVVLQEIPLERVASSRTRINPRGVKRKMSNYPLGPRKRQPTRRVDFTERIRTVK